MLYIVATPIGNLSDITLRALETLKKADLVLCEDTRITSKLLFKYKIETPLDSYHHKSSENKVRKIIEKIKEGKTVAMVCDGGTPGISDPAGKLVERALKEVPRAKITPIPGPCAAITAASICGFPMEKFVFMGFPPQKKKRKKFFEKLLSSDFPVIFYESPHRILKTMEEISEMEEREVFILREATKLYEKTYRGSIKGVLKEIKKERIRGEFTVILKNG